ncbi:hypothetical protein Q4F19_17310 [Sphingomonas sp. BIUV-7]|uniref:HTH marR-type domain-containing protein n=2 Tax=Sphingomonas natans TaxID=3063330 RepID=A0ABT8YCS9_9SPHN|nr:hypothetical protein [Sphingomonas sp. BIUV-7]
MALASVATILIEEDRNRARLYEAGNISNPAWTMLLGLFVSGERGETTMVSTACIASGASLATAHRHLRRLESLGLVSVARDKNDRRRAYVSLTPGANGAIKGHLMHLQARLTTLTA